MTGLRPPPASREYFTVDKGLRLRAKRADGAAVDVLLPLPRGRSREDVKVVLDKLLKATAAADTTDVIAALAMGLAAKTLTARPGSQSVDATRALVEQVLDAARDAETTMSRKIADIIKRQKLAKLVPTATVRQACKLMAERAVGAVLITGGDGKLAGIFTERDLVKRVAAPGLDVEKTTLAEVMTRMPETMTPDDPAVVALRRMRDGGFRHMPIVKGEKLLGVVSARDFIGAEMKQLEVETAFRSAVIAEGFHPSA
ncbi:MAG: CBS domain-containing protein [Alphaproteobacteria bacterium]|nr:CBS domain-containing protein [Alphaproteobacteria bacterium]